jgi:hypothetical protein
LKSKMVRSKVALPQNRQQKWAGSEKETDIDTKEGDCCTG